VNITDAFLTQCIWITQKTFVSDLKDWLYLKVLMFCWPCISVYLS